MTNPIITDLNKRYTAKKYDKSKRVSIENMEVIKEALRLSPSSINSQPWKFIVVESDQAKQRFHSTFANAFEFNQPHAIKTSQLTEECVVGDMKQYMNFFTQLA